MNEEDRVLLESFERQTLPREEWNQRCHVAIGYIYIREHGFEGALEKMRRGVKELNKVHGVIDTETSGYSETMTVAFLKMIDALDRAYDSTFPTVSSREFCDVHTQLMSKHVLRFFYSPDRRMHPEAKSRFVEPDLTQLPGKKGDSDKMGDLAL